MAKACMEAILKDEKALDGHSDSLSSLRQENHNVQIMQLCRSKISVPTLTAQVGVYTPPSPSNERLTSDYYIEP